MSDEKPSVKVLKDLLVDTLVEQIENGVTVIDKEGGEHVISAPAPVLAVAAKVIKDWAEEAKADTQAGAQVERLANYLAQRRPDLKTSVQ